MRLAGLTAFLLLTAGLAAPAFPQQPSATSPATQLLPAAGRPGTAIGTVPPQPQASLEYLIVIENRTGSVVRAVDPPASYAINRPGTPLGTVTRTTHRIDLAGRPNQNARHPRVVSSAVDGLILQLFAEESGTCGELAIKPQSAPPGSGPPAAVALDDNAIYVDIQGGHGIFGGSHPLIVGNPVALYRSGAYLQLDAAGSGLRIGDTLVIGVFGPETWPRSLSIENTEGGLVTVTLDSGAATACGYVRQALAGPEPGPADAQCQPGAVRCAGEQLIELCCAGSEPAGVLRIGPAAPPAEADTAGVLVAAMYTAQTDGLSPLFGGFLYPVSGLETQLRLPRLAVEIKTAGGGRWLPLDGVVAPAALAEMAALRFSWTPEDIAGQPPQAQGAGLEQLDPQLVPQDTPSFRE